MKKELIQMDTDSWIKDVPDYPANRDVLKRLKKDHLNGDLKSGAMELVSAINLDGKLIKIDGHSRSAAWEKGTLQKPAVVDVIVYYIDNIEEAHKLYDSFTARATAATATEEVYTAKKRLSFEPKSKLCNSSWKTAFAIHGFNDQFEGMAHFIEELRIIDNWMVQKSRDLSWIVPIRAAILYTLKEDQSVAQRFWALYRDPDSNDSFVNRLREVVNGAYGVSGPTVIGRVYTAALGSFNAFKSDNR